MRSAMNPIRSRMQMQQGPMQPEAPENFDTMVYPPGMNGQVDYSGMQDIPEMPPGQGDRGMEPMDPNGLEDQGMGFPGPGGDAPPPMGQPQAMPVHDMGQAQQFYKGMGRTMGPGVQQITGAMEQTPQSPLRSKLHAAQHQMMAGDQKSAIQMKRMELSSKQQELQDVMQRIRRGEIMDTDGKLFNKLQALSHAAAQGLAQFPMDDR